MYIFMKYMHAKLMPYYCVLFLQFLLCSSVVAKVRINLSSIILTGYQLYQSNTFCVFFVSFIMARLLNNCDWTCYVIIFLKQSVPINYWWSDLFWFHIANFKKQKRRKRGKFQIRPEKIRKIKANRGIDSWKNSRQAFKQSFKAASDSLLFAT